MEIKIESMKNFALGFAILFFLFSCEKSPTKFQFQNSKSQKISEAQKTARFPTWQERTLILPDTPEIPVEQNLAESDVPFAGIVSHHLLAYKFIDQWFSELAKHNPKIKTFIVLSPSHWNLSRADFSLASGAWNCDGTFLETDEKIQKIFLEKLDGKIEDDVFLYEHGVSTLAPFIAKYFPKSKIVAIAYDADLPVNTKIANRLSNALEPFVAKKDFFILISSDFAHHHNLEKTKQIDNVSRNFFADPNRTTWQFAICDNPVAMYALTHATKEKFQAIIQRNTNSFEIFWQDEDDITSYFLCYFVKKKK